MNIIDVNSEELFINIDDVTSLNEKLNELKEDIILNGLINPIVIMKHSYYNDWDYKCKYKVLEGNKRCLMCKSIGLKTIKCELLDDDDPRIDNILLPKILISDAKSKRNKHTTKLSELDKINIYYKLYNINGGDIQKLCDINNLPKKTIEKYIKVNELPKEIINLLDKKRNNKINLNILVDLTKLNSNIDKQEFLNKINDLNLIDKSKIIKKCIKLNIDDINNIDEL